MIAMGDEICSAARALEISTTESTIVKRGRGKGKEMGEVQGTKKMGLNLLVTHSEFVSGT